MGCEMTGKEYVESDKIGEAYCQDDENKLLGE